MMKREGAMGKTVHDEYQPLCLMVYLGGRCRLSCLYCYGSKDRPQEQTVSMMGFKHSLELVAHHCRIKKVPLTLVFHGDNEPLVYYDRIRSLVSVARETLAGLGVGLVLVCTTSGVASRKVMGWASKTFDHITLSWDGPPLIQDVNRPFKNGKGTSGFVEKAFNILKQGRCRVAVRTTITQNSCKDLVDIADYFKEKGVTRMVVCPVYPNRDETFPRDLIPDPELFATFF